ncbi:hypothetical protein PHYSODRAFT_256365 [Phytophthora sojae]|uniref:Histone H4 n=1 Tax=Phytophthora sojae (strain P6497) TaxID=1094619 RepID=G5A3H6_PHYSP|nr:hypothetical protein PHYSODRAFT_256365 [Phytophthora sojae]EGZ10192.1 hypothetical protein PHYSODRAFT_256365 [Phytophthora sojae]|eukprot:XP_009535053.1 hypothetical protein PHYSODRAFT_256365 [Phytophthora sojae]
MAGRGKGAQGLGQGGAKRITRPAIRRLARRAGVIRMSALVYHQAVLRVYLANLIRDTVTYTEHGNRKTLTGMDVVYALKRPGEFLYGYGV